MKIAFGVKVIYLIEAFGDLTVAFFSLRSKAAGDRAKIILRQQLEFGGAVLLNPDFKNLFKLEASYVNAAPLIIKVFLQKVVFYCTFFFTICIFDPGEL